MERYAKINKIFTKSEHVIS